MSPVRPHRNWWTVLWSALLLAPLLLVSHAPAQERAQAQAQGRVQVQPGQPTVQVSGADAFRSELRGIVLGDELGWDIEEVGILLSVGEATPVELQIYSPGFDPDDYRGPIPRSERLGDERYDRGAGTLAGRFVLEEDDTVLAADDFAVESHRWVTFFRGDLAAGGYLLRTQFRGNAKNAFVVRVVAPDPSVVSLSFHAGISLFDVRSTEWTVHAEIDVGPDILPARYALYDGDGAEELEARLERPDGSVEALPVSGDLEWITWRIEQPGRYRVAFRLADGASQLSNTVAIREVFPEPVTAEVVDVDGAPLPFEPTVEGYAQRRVDLTVPPAWRLMDVQTEEGERATGVDATEVRFGFSGGHVRYVLAQAPARLRIEAELDLPGGPRPYPLTLEADGSAVRLPAEGVLESERPAGTIAFEATVPGATVEGPSRATLSPGQTTTVRFVVTPTVNLALEAVPRERIVGEIVRVTAVATSDFPDLLPGDLVVALPEALRPLEPPRRVAPLSATRDLQLSFDAEALEPGLHELRASLAPWGLEAGDAVTVVAPAALQLDKIALTPHVRVGDTARWQVTVRNVGGAPAADVRVRDPLASGLLGSPLDTFVDLAPGEERVFEVAAEVGAAAPGTIRNRAEARFGDVVLDAEAAVEVLRPDPTLTRSLDHDVVVPGETVTVSLTVGNDGGDDLAYLLTDTPPEWLDPLGPVRFEGDLVPGAQATHSYRATVAFGAAARAGFDARLDWRGAPLRATDQIERRLIPLAKTVDVPRILEGDETAFVVRVENPLARALPVTIREAPDDGLGLDAPDEVELRLEANEVRTLRFASRPGRLGTLANEVSAWVGGAPAAMPARAEVEVVAPLVPERRSTVTLPFALDDVERVDALLLRHDLPEGGSYVVGSSLLDGEPIPEPLLKPADERAPAALYWQLEPVEAGVLSYRLQHEDPLGGLAAPALTARLLDREAIVQGDASFADLVAATEIDPVERDGTIREPLPGTVFRTVDQTRVVIEAPIDAVVEVRLNGEPLPDDKLGEITTDLGRGMQRLAWYGLPLQLGRNTIEALVDGVPDRVDVQRAGAPVRLELRPVATAADGRHAIAFDVLALDANDLSVGFGALTVATDLEPVDADAFPDRSGHQILMEDGRATLRLRPVPRPRGVRVRASFNDLDLDRTVYLGGADEVLWNLQGSATARLQGGETSFEGLARGYLEAPVGNGTVQAALDTGDGIAPRDEPSTRFPTTGSGNGAEAALQSEDRFAVRYDDADVTLGYWHESIDLPALPGLASGTALRASARLDAGSGVLGVDAFGALLPSDTIDVELVPDGTRRYRLGVAVKPGSERVTLVTGGTERPLERLRDYVLDPDGVLTLAEPLWPSEDGQPVRLHVRAARVEAVRDAWAYGAGASYRIGDWQLAFGAAQRDAVQLGAELSYRAAGASFGARWRTEAGDSRLDLDGAFRRGIFEATMDLSAAFGSETTVQGRARLAAEFVPGQRLALEHRSSPDRDRSDVLYELSLGAFELGLGAGYNWQPGTAVALGRLGWARDDVQVTVTHAQGLSASAASTSDVDARYDVDANLTLRAGADYLWGGGVTGTVGLDQRLGDANLSVSYQLPAADGRGNRARFGVSAPLPLGGGFELDVTGDAAYGFSSGEGAAGGGLSVRYRNDSLVATLGSDVAWDQADAEPFRVVLRAGASGQIDHQQTLAFDASYQLVPIADGTFTASYALRGRDATVLTYHRLETGSEPVLEGELATTVHPRRSWQLRPHLAYRLYLDDPTLNLYQASFGAHLYPWASVGVGGALHHLAQPGTGTNRTAASIEASFRVVDPAWIVIGTTFSGFDGLTHGTQNGFYLRLDAFAGSR